MHGGIIRFFIWHLFIRFGSALNHDIHLHACVTDGVFMPAGDAPLAFLPA